MTLNRVHSLCFKKYGENPKTELLLIKARIEALTAAPKPSHVKKIKVDVDHGIDVYKFN